MTPKDFERTYAVNVIAAFEFARQIAARGNHCADGSSFVFIASVMASVGVALKVGYCSSKGALVAGMKAMALELAMKNIRVNTVSPGVIATELVDKNYQKAPGDALDSILKNQVLGMGMPENVAHSCIYLLSSAGSFITGTDLKVDGGYTAR
jgi:NAD(P)-dependent dehydrogenase (short-subunit alcohol dehydrogenase family)